MLLVWAPGPKACNYLGHQMNMIIVCSVCYINTELSLFPLSSPPLLTSLFFSSPSPSSPHPSLLSPPLLPPPFLPPPSFPLSSPSPPLSHRMKPASTIQPTLAPHATLSMKLRQRGTKLFFRMLWRALVLSLSALMPPTLTSRYVLGSIGGSSRIIVHHMEPMQIQLALMGVVCINCRITKISSICSDSTI